MDGSKRLTLIAAILGTFVVGIDLTVVNVALPAIADDVGGGLAGQQWVVNAYLLLLGSLILIGGSLGDVLGARRVFRLGVGGFGVVSALCAIAPTIETLVAMRALQGVFGALLTPSALAIIVATFAAGERGRAIGTWTAWSGISMMIGPLVGGQIVDASSWRVIFAINIPFVVVALAMSTRIPHVDARRAGRRIDGVGAALIALGLAGPTFGLIEQPRLGWGAVAVWLPILVGAVLIAGFVLWEARHPEPMLPLRLFAERNFAAGNVETLVLYAGLGLNLFFLAIYLQQVAGYSALQSGLATLPTTIVMFALSSRMGALAGRFGARPFMGFGPLVAAAGLLLMLRVDADVDYVSELLPAVLVFSLGLVATVAPLTATVLAAADEGNAGIASAVNNAVARVGVLLATAAVGAAVAAQFAGALDDRLDGRSLSAEARRAVQRAERATFARTAPATVGPAERALLARASEEASTRAFHVAMGTAAALAALGGALGLIGIRDPRRRAQTV